MSIVMRIAVMSDLHNEFERGQTRTAFSARPFGHHEGHPTIGPDISNLKGQADLLLLGGDIDIGSKAIDYAAWSAQYLECPIVAITGNHEFYHGTYEHVLSDMRACARKQEGVHFLENEAAIFEIGGMSLRVLGCTLWTDYALFGSYRDVVQLSKNLAADGLADHRLIKHDDGETFMPDDALRLHNRSICWLKEQIAEPFAGTTIIMTHHAPSVRSVPEKFKGDFLNAAFASDLEALVEESGAALWVHGHTHHDVDYDIGDTRVLSRQRGYPHEERNFSPVIVDLPVPP